MSQTVLMAIAGTGRRVCLASKAITIGILEDDPDMRGFLSTLFRQEEDMQLLFACSHLAEARAALLKGRPDICLVDIRVPDGNGLDLVEEAVKQGSKALILTVLGDKSSVLLAFELGASGYLLKDTPPEQIKSNIRAVITGGNPISPQAAAHVLSMFSAAGKTEAARENVLTDRERDVLSFFARGLSYKEAAEALELSVHTIADHVKSIYSKMGVHSRNEAVYEAVKNGWLEL